MTADAEERPKRKGRVKVYNINYNGRESRIVAATSQKVAALLMGADASTFRGYGCETRNPEQIALAMSQPGVCWRKGNNLGAVWEVAHLSQWQLQRCEQAGIEVPHAVR